MATIGVILISSSRRANERTRTDMTSQTHSSLSSTWIGFQEIGFQEIGLQGLDTYAQAGFVMPIAGKPACERRNNNTQVVAT